MDSVIILKLTPDQWQDYKELRLRSLKEDPMVYELTYEKALKMTNKQWQAPLMETEDNCVLFARIEENLVGMLSGRLVDAETVVIEEEFVAPEAKGKGISKKLLIHLLDEFRKNSKLKTIHVKLFSTQGAAINLYKTTGFEIVEKTDEAFVMRKSLLQSSNYTS